ncbi:UPF0161 protein At3g09310 [Dioscorea cayenensis subsp. rotundata]|uniref:UPF0161 protein At3g09310 n=1 Tax=Dioscorea cayennensis subsp. rotundata TaxID=55577 RepID=A0AB40CA84_DIOCR|nr:UPF0161 protein At3g09310 [Dioscorea cayenensis subsp. rotundata]XP_039136018.1 UPF0161 protein At3g09310 [Dioscorea cayenensis subsp. rotundata]
MEFLAVPLSFSIIHRSHRPKFSAKLQVFPQTLISPSVIRPQSLSSSSSRIQACALNESDRDRVPDEEVKDLGVKAALSMLKFYKREISPLLPPSCRYVPTCSQYSMEAYKKYGVAKGTILTAWRLCRCNPLGGSGFDPPRWFGEENKSEDM